MQVHRRLLALAAAIVSALALTATAQAATPFTAGVGADPDVAVGADGMGHVVWTHTAAPDNAMVAYCRVPAGGSACAGPVRHLNFGEATAARPVGGPQVFVPAPNKVVIVGSCWNCGGGNQVRQWTSTDNGITFPVAGGTQIGDVFEPSGQGLWLDAQNRFVGVSAGRVKAMEAGPPVTGGNGLTYASGGVFAYGPEVVQVPGSTKLVAAVNDLDLIKYGVYTSPAASLASMNNPANWLTEQTLPSAEPDTDDSGLTAGPNGVFLHYRWTIPNDSRVAVRRFDPATNTFGAPAYIEGDDPIDNNSLDYTDVFQDPSGRLHAVWRTLHDDNRLRYRVSDTTGTTFGPAGNLAVKEAFYHPELAAGADGKGFAVWTPTVSGNVRVVALDPQPEPAPPTPPAPGGGTPGGAVPPPDPYAGSPGSNPAGPTASKSTTTSGAKVTFAVPKGCVAPGKTFRVRLTWKKQKRKGNKFVKVTRSDFYIGSRRVKIDRKAPFTQVLRVTASAKSGSSVTVRARAFIKVKRGKQPKKSITQRIKVC